MQKWKLRKKKWSYVNPLGLELAPTKSWSNLSWESQYASLRLQHLCLLSMACGDTLVRQAFPRHTVGVHPSVDAWEKSVMVVFKS